MRAKIIGLAGSQSLPSRSRALVEVAVDRAAPRYDLVGSVFDIGDIGPSLGAAGKISDLAPTAQAILDGILTADALVLASLVYKGGHAGL